MSEENISLLLLQHGAPDEHISQMLNSPCSKEQFRLRTVVDLYQAKQLLTKSTYDVVLLYLDIATDNRFDAVRELRQVDSYMSIIVITESSDDKAGIDAIKAGADDYLVTGKIYRDVLERSIRYSAQRRKEHRSVDQKLREYNEHLEQLVAERTAANQKLEAEALERRQMESLLEGLNKKLAATVEKLTQSNKALREFAHIIAHDLKAPLRAIGTLANWILTDYYDKLDQKGRENVTLLEKRAQRMDKVVDSILWYSEINGVAFNQKIDLDALVREVISEMPVSEGTTIRVADKLPTIGGERTRLAEVFRNLLANGIKYTQQGEGRIEIGCTEQEDFWQFRISDNGRGIEPRYFEKIFEVFQTLIPHETAEGAGIGLAVVKKIIQMYGGKVWVESEPSNGSSFFFTFPKSGNSESTKLERDIRSNRK